MHQDPGLQPERTVMAWARSTLSLCVAGAIFLRWIPQYGVPIVVMAALCLATAGGIYFTQRTRYKIFSRGIVDERIHADVAAILFMSSAVFIVGILGIVVLVGAL